jgi:hypothetical protein
MHGMGLGLIPCMHLQGVVSDKEKERLEEIYTWFKNWWTADKEVS